jgi:hypothetical protein
MKTKENFLKYDEDIDTTLATQDNCWDVYTDGFNAGFAHNAADTNPHKFNQTVPEEEDRKAAKRENMFYRIWHSGWYQGNEEGKVQDWQMNANLCNCPFNNMQRCIGSLCQAWNKYDPPGRNDVCLLISQQREQMT